MGRYLDGGPCCEAFEKELAYGHCCEMMADCLHDPDTPLKYNLVQRRYYLASKGKAKKNSIYHCPLCGSKLPKILIDEWIDILEKEYGLVDLYGKDAQQIPKEFKTDAWWRKRNL